MSGAGRGAALSKLSHAGRGLGYKPDLRYRYGLPVRDAAHALAQLPTPPAASSMADMVVEVLDQGAAPFCVSHGTAQALRVCQVRNGVARPRLASRLWIMYFAHAVEHDVSSFDGAVIADAVQILEDLGFPPEDVWPYSDSSAGPFKTKPPADVVRLAYDRIAPLDYGRVMSTGDARIDDIKRSLAAKKPIVFGTQVSEAFCEGAAFGPDFTVDTPQPLDAIAGGHCLLAVGYDDARRAVRVPNSWGPGWGDGGFCWMSYDYIKQSTTTDIWYFDFQGTDA